jgi:hypothetical protein
MLDTLTSGIALEAEIKIKNTADHYRYLEKIITVISIHR